MINGIRIMTMQPAINTEYHTAGLPVWICPGGMKLRTKASNEPPNPTPPIIHIRIFPFPSLKGLSADFILYRRVIAAANISMYMIRYSRIVSCDSI